MKQLRTKWQWGCSGLRLIPGTLMVSSQLKTCRVEKKEKKRKSWTHPDSMWRRWGKTSPGAARRKRRVKKVMKVPQLGACVDGVREEEWSEWEMEGVVLHIPTTPTPPTQLHNYTTPPHRQRAALRAQGNERPLCRQHPELQVWRTKFSLRFVCVHISIHIYIFMYTSVSLICSSHVSAAVIRPLAVFVPLPGVF